ncbi:MAG TPA: LytR C-terminal domain-containing protein [Candidatus Saccharimonadales bacterium]|nr:LytR C-terminal domain-containing protein [Candidatus Saccharimonadales bacterium]
MIRRSTFDGANRYTVAVVEKNPVHITLVSFAPKNDTISILDVKGMVPAGGFNAFVDVPVDGYIETREFDSSDISKELFHVLFHPGGEHSNMTPIDTLRLAVFARGVPAQNVATKTVTTDMDSPTVDKTIGTFFADSTAVAENQRIAVINASGMLGLGNRLARYVTNMGGNVVTVQTAQEDTDQSKISYSGSSSYTARKLSRILHMPLSQTGEKTVADVIITIGKDSTRNLVF